MKNHFFRFAQLIRHDARLSLLARLVYCDLVDLCTKDGAILVSNNYLSKIFNVEEYDIVLALCELDNLRIIRLETLDKQIKLTEPLMMKNKRVKQKPLKDKSSRIIYLSKDTQEVFGIKESDLYDTWK